MLMTDANNNYIHINDNTPCPYIFGRFQKAIYLLIKKQSVTNSSQGNHNDQKDICNWLADGRTTG